MINILGVEIEFIRLSKLVEIALTSLKSSTITVMKRILVPTDFSEQSMDAIASAATLLQKVEGEIIILHVITGVEDPMEKEEAMEKIFEITELQGLPHHFKQVVGKPIDSILAEPVDMIVMGSKGAKGFQSFFIGTNAEKVAKHAKCPVFILKNKCNLGNVKSIVFPTSMKRDDEDVIEDVRNLQKIYGAKLHIVKAYDDSLVKQFDVEKRLKEYAEFHQIENYSVSGRPGIDESDVIIRFAQEINADLIAMATHDRKGIGKLFGGFISGDVINTNQKPLWVKSLHYDF